MRELLLGLLEFREQNLHSYRDRFRELGERQEPTTFFIACSDSRVVPSLLTSSEPGELFTMRNVGNLVPPAQADGTSSGDLSEASAIEYAVSVLEVSNIVVCGHSNCGAMRAVTAAAPLDDAPNLRAWLDHARPAVALAGAGAEGGASADEVSRANVLLQLRHLATYPQVRRRLDSGTLALAGWWFDIATGEVHVLDRTRQRFELLSRDSLDRLAG
jgi:carbonic anhydrase